MGTSDLVLKKIKNHIFEFQKNLEKKSANSQ
jgi:hypothetical protein